MATTEDLATTTQEDTPPERARRRVGDLWWAVPGALVGAIVIYAAQRGLIDDAYITLSYVRNVAEHLHWGLIPTEESNTATSPLNVMLLVLATWVGRVTGELRPVLGLEILTVVLSAAMAVWAAQIARRINVSGAWSLAVLAAVFANPFVNSALGLEVVPVAAFLIGLTAQAAAGRRLAFGILAGLLVLTRPDLGIVVAVVYLAVPAMRRRFWVVPLTAAAVVLPWWAFSWYHFGSAVPTTFVIKTLQRSFGDATFSNGLWKMWQLGATLPLALALVPAAIGLVTVVCMLAAGLQPAAARGVVGAGGPGRRRHRRLRRVLPAAASRRTTGTTSVPLSPLALPASSGWRCCSAGPHGAASAHPSSPRCVLAVAAVVSFGGRPVPWTHPVIFGNWALPGTTWRSVRRSASSSVTPTVKAPPEIGTVAYACDCSVVDVFSDPGSTLPLIEKRIREAGPVMRFLLEANFARLDRTQQPRCADYRLVWTRERPSAGLPAWHTGSPWTGEATIYLEPISKYPSSPAVAEGFEPPDGFSRLSLSRRVH